MRFSPRVFFWLCLAPGLAAPLSAFDTSGELVATTPVLYDGVLYVASATWPGHRGHLRAIDVLDTLAVTLWDAADRVPLPGVGAAPGDTPESDPPALPGPDNRYRSVYSALDGALLPLTAANAALLQGALDVPSVQEAARLVHAARGRTGGTPALPAGSGDDPLPLWSISRSSPLLVGASRLGGAARRDRILYAGAEDGMLHAFLVSRCDADTGLYPVVDPAGGAELWAFLPGSFLPHLQRQPFADGLGELAMHLDGPPVATELFFDHDGDGRRSWRTLLAATGTLPAPRRSCLFVLDVTDPYRPALLWERLLPGELTGRTRGVTPGGCGGGGSQETCLYLTADAGFGAPGVHALAVEAATGALRWQFGADYAAVGPVAEASPAAPALMDRDGDGADDTLLFGDLVGRLWALALADGLPLGDGPLFTVPGGAAEPIGAGVAVQGRLVVFGTGGVSGADPATRYAVYAVELLADGGHLRWSFPLAFGEQVWAPPLLDAAGNLLLATAADYADPARTGTGRILALDRAGGERFSRATAAATLGRPVAAPGVVVSVALTGAMTRFGSAGRLAGPARAPGVVRVLSWRER